MEKIYKNKSVTLVDDYEVKISNQLQMMAEDELRETEEIRSNAITALRDWTAMNPRINKIRLDSKFLLRFLRHKKFSITMAQDSMEKYIVLRRYNQDGFYPFLNLDIKIPSILKLYDEGYMFALPKRDAFGRRIIFCRASAFRPSVFQNHEVLKLHSLVYETLLEDEENQIRGCVHILDFTGFGLNYLTLFSVKEFFRILKNSETLLPMRHKEFHACNVLPALKYVLDFGIGCASEKMRSRVQLYSKFEEMKNIDKNLLPLEYGGKIPMKEMIASFKLEIEASQQILLKHDQMDVNAEMYPANLVKGSVRAVKNPIDSKPTKHKKSLVSDIQGSFRKLEID